MVLSISCCEPTCFTIDCNGLIEFVHCHPAISFRERRTFDCSMRLLGRLCGGGWCIVHQVLKTRVEAAHAVGAGRPLAFRGAQALSCRMIRRRASMAARMGFWMLSVG